MRTAAVLIAGLVATYGVTDAWAHDDHGETVVITGTVQAIDSNRILLEIRDHVSLEWKRVWVTTTEDTRYKRGKARVQAEAAQIMTGERVVAVVTGEQTRDYSVRLLALQIELSGPRRRYIVVKTPGGEVLRIVISENAAVPDNKKERNRKEVDRRPVVVDTGNGKDPLGPRESSRRDDGEWTAIPIGTTGVTRSRYLERKCSPAKRALPLDPKGAVWMKTAVSNRAVHPRVTSTDMCTGQAESRT